jgi:hypothetical protein
MTPAYGLPILLDPRLSNVTTKFGLSTSKKEKYEILIYTSNMHYEWYLRASQVKINEQRSEHEADLRLMVLEAENLAANCAKRILGPQKLMMTWAGIIQFQHRIQNRERRVIAQPPLPPAIPLISADDYYETSKQQYKTYMDACHNVVPWRNLYPDDKLSVGEKGILWQDK